MSIDPVFIDFCSNDFDAMRELYRGWDHRYDQVSVGAFRGRLTFTQVGDIQFARNCWGQAIHYQGIAPAAHFGAAFPLWQTEPGKWMGQAAGLSDVIVQRPGKASDFNSPLIWDAIVISIPEELVYSVHDACADDEDLIDHLHGTVALPAATVARLKVRIFRYLHYVKRLSGSAGEALAAAEHAERLVKDVTSALLNAVRSERKPPLPSQKRKIVLRAEERMLDDPDNPCSVLDLCKDLAVSERALHYAFSDIRGSSPKKWLQTLRLNEARRRLRQSGPDDVMVKQVAGQAGFTHMGHFGQSYARLFGERPVDTLRAASPMTIQSFQGFQGVRG